jgi:hypothetical protein
MANPWVCQVTHHRRTGETRDEAYLGSSPLGPHGRNFMSELKPKRDTDERHTLPADDAEAALKGLMQVDPASEPVPGWDLHQVGGPGGRTWRMRCRGCGLELSGPDDVTPEALEVKRTHRCEPGGGPA